MLNAAERLPMLKVTQPQLNAVHRTINDGHTLLNAVQDCNGSTLPRERLHMELSRTSCRVQLTGNATHILL